MTQKEIDTINENGPTLFPLGTKVIIKGKCPATGVENEQGVVTAHGYSTFGHGKLVGVKVDDPLGSALLYNRQVLACTLIKVDSQD